MDHCSRMGLRVRHCLPAERGGAFGAPDTRVLARGASVTSKWMFQDASLTSGSLRLAGQEGEVQVLKVALLYGGVVVRDPWSAKRKYPYASPSSSHHRNPE